MYLNCSFHTDIAMFESLWEWIKSKCCFCCFTTSSNNHASYVIKFYTLSLHTTNTAIIQKVTKHFHYWSMQATTFAIVFSFQTKINCTLAAQQLEHYIEKNCIDKEDVTINICEQYDCSSSKQAYDYYVKHINNRGWIVL